MNEEQRESSSLGPGSPDDPQRKSAAVMSLTFEDLYQDHFDFVWRCVRRLGVADAAVEDAVQEVFVVAHRKHTEFDGQVSPRIWLYAISRRVAHDFRRTAQRKHAKCVSASDLGDLGATNAPLQDDAMIRAQRSEVLYALLEQLDPDKREVFILSELEGLRATEVAQAVGLSVEGVYSRLRRARDQFNQAVSRYQASGASHD